MCCVCGREKKVFKFLKHIPVGLQPPLELIDNQESGEGGGRGTDSDAGRVGNATP